MPMAKEALLIQWMVLISSEHHLVPMEADRRPGENVSHEGQSEALSVQWTVLRASGTCLTRTEPVLGILMMNIQHRIELCCIKPSS